MTLTKPSMLKFSVRGGKPPRGLPSAGVTKQLLSSKKNDSSDLPPPMDKYQQRHIFYTRPERPPGVEIPVLSILSVVINSFLYWISTEHSKTKDSNMITFADFIHKYIDRIQHLDVVNKHTIHAVLNDVPTNASEHSTVKKQLYVLLCRILNVPIKDNDHIVRFRIGDLQKLESLILRYVPTLPPIYYTSRRDRIKILQRTLICNMLMSFATASIQLAAGKTSDIPDGVPLDYHAHHTTEQPHDKFLKFGKAQPTSDIPQVRFTDVAGLEQAKQETQEFVEFLKNPRKFTDLGATVPKGALLIGPPGTGKTLLAKAVAGEAGVPFYSTSGSDFIELFVGVGSSRIRDLFDRARKNAPAIVFIDEIDTIGRHRSQGSHIGGGGSDERESTLNALLVELDGFGPNTGVVTLAGTNRGDILDTALTRPGRFDRQINLSKPTVSERKAIFEIHLKPIKLTPQYTQDQITIRLAALTPGFTGAEIKSVCNEAAIYAARRDAEYVTIEDLEQAIERLIGGLKHTGDVLTPEMRVAVATHEAGHAVAGWFLKHAEPVLKLSIVPRASGALGYTQMLPEEVLLSKKEAVEDRICVLLGGRAAEFLHCGTVTTGASDDLEKATRMAQAYVTILGFDDRMGLRSYPRRDDKLLSAYGEETANLIDERVDILLREQWDRCIKLLKSKEAEVKNVADLLLEREAITVNDLHKLLGDHGKKPSKTLSGFTESLKPI